MKQFILKLTLVAALLLSLAKPEAYAYDFEYEGIGYTVISTGDLTCRASELVQDVEDLVIPGVVPFQGKELRVITIDREICKYNKVIKSVSIADEFETIGNGAFANCPNLVSAKLPSNLKEIPEQLFYKCGKLQEIEIPNQIRKIGDKAFGECDLTSVVIPDSTTIIGGSAFYCNHNLKEVKLGTSVEEIGDSAFGECDITSVVIPDSTTIIGTKAFYCNYNLKEVKLGTSVEEIKGGAFVGCPIDNFVIPSSVKRIKSNSFWDIKVELPNEDMFHDLNIAIEKSDVDLEVLYDDNTKEVFGSWDNVCLNRTIESASSYTPRCLRIEGKFLEIGEGVSTYVFSDPSARSNISVKCIVLCKDARLDESYPGGEDLDTIVIKSHEPPYCPTFSNTRYMSVKVLVPPGTLEIYQNADGWRNFWNIEESDIASGISDVMADTAIQPKEEYGRYDLSGRKVSGDYHGVVVVKYTDGSTAKVLQQ